MAFVYTAPTDGKHAENVAINRKWLTVVVRASIPRRTVLPHSEQVKSEQAGVKS